jgi:16S rRNA (cytosine1402-N4)-methyltransferase
MQTTPHLSVLLNEIITAFDGHSIENFVDCTLGAGGHAKAILQAHPEIKRYIGFDQDPLARETALTNLEPFQNKLEIIPTNFEHLKQELSKRHIPAVDGILMDLGVSSMQLDLPEKGFSFSKDGPLDMRMNPEQELTAEIIVNSWSESELGRIFRNYGEEKQWRIAAQVIVNSRKAKAINTTKELSSLLYPVLVRRAKPGISPLTLIFQALRIAVNGELDVLERVLPQALELLKPGGRLAVISFHSLEDRIVKQFFQYSADDKEDTRGLGGIFIDKAPTMEILTRKPIIPGDEEIAGNPRARSAKLRIARKL